MATTNGVVNASKTDTSIVPTIGTPLRPTVCVFCGASSGNSPAHLEAARSLAKVLHQNGLYLVYGGGTVGLMGELARTLVSLSGPQSVHGVIPAALMKWETGHWIDENVYGKTTIVKDMHTRKQLMARTVIESGRGGGFVALTGGFGTLEELMEMTTWNQLGIHEAPVVVFNVEGYWDGILQWKANAVKAGFISKENQEIMVTATTAEEVVRQINEYKVSEGRLKLNWDEK